MVRRHARWISSFAVVALAAAACDGGGSNPARDDGAGAADELTDDEQELADAFAADFADGQDGLGVTAEDGSCMAIVLMDELGVEPFEEAGVTPDDVAGDTTPGQLLGEGAISEEQAAAIYDGWQGCVDLEAAFARSFQQEYEADDATRECFEAGLAEGRLLRQYTIASFTRGEELDPAEPPLEDFIALLGSCTAGDTGGTADVLVDSIAASLAEGRSLTDEQTECLAESIVDAVGVDQLLQGAADGAFADAPPELQQAVVDAITDAAADCDVPLTSLGSG